jgi:general stress protein 26
MAHPDELEAKLWKSLKSDRTFMLGLAQDPTAHLRPMTAQLDGDRGPIYVFTSRDTSLVADLVPGARALGTFASKGHDLFATLHGRLSVCDDRAVIDRLWNRFVAAWFEGGREDPKVTLLRFDAERAEVWIDASSLVAGIKLLLGIDPKESYKDKAGEVALR